MLFYINYTVFLRPLPILGMGMVVMGSVVLLLLLTVQHIKNVDPLFYGIYSTIITSVHLKSVTNGKKMNVI